MSFLSRLFGQAQKQTPVKQVQTPAPVKQSAPPAPSKAPEAKPAAKTYKVTGVSHYLDNLMELACENSDYLMNKRALIEEGLTEQRVYEHDFYIIKAEVIPEPDNPHDPKAIKVVLDGQHVGYIKAGSCAHLLKVIQENRIKSIDCLAGGGRYKYVSIDSYTESGNEIYSMETNDVPYFVHLTITEENTNK